MARQTLQSLVDAWSGGDYRPNRPESGALDVVDPSAALSDFIADLQSSGADLGRWDEDEWRAALRANFHVEDEQITDFLETLASWGIVDSNWYRDEGL